MDGGMVAVGGIVVAVAGGQVEAAGDLLVEQNVPDGVVDLRVHTEGELADVPGALVDVQDLVHIVRVVAGGLDDLAVLELQIHIPEQKAVIGGRHVVGDVPVDGVLHGRGVDLTVGDVPVAVHPETGDALDGEGDVCAGSDDTDLVGPGHQVLEGLHGPAHLVVVHKAGPEIEVLILFRGNARQLGHSVVGIPEHRPLGMVAPLRQMDGAPVILAVTLLGLVADVVPHADIGGGPDVDIGVHVPHPLQLVGGDLLHVLRVGSLDQGTFYGVVEDVDKGLAAHSIGFLDQGLHQSGLTAVELNQDLLALLQAHSAADQELGEFADTGIFHGGSSLSFQSLRVTAQKKRGRRSSSAPRGISCPGTGLPETAWDRCSGSRR